MKLAVLDDYQKVATEMADWSRLDGSVAPVFFNEPFGSIGDAVSKLKDFASVPPLSKVISKVASP